MDKLKEILNRGVSRRKFVAGVGATAAATAELVDDDVEEQFAALEKQGEVDRLLNELKSKRKAG